MLKAYKLAFIALLPLTLLQGEAAYAAADKDSTKSNVDTVKPKPLQKPIIGLGIGVLSYFGNVKNTGNVGENVFSGRIGYELMFAQKVNNFMEFHLYALFGQLAAEERTTTLNWNFQSQLSGGGFHLLFKILPKADVTPYVFVGFESYEYLSRTDMYDQYGRKYYYWSDGSIRSLPQTDPNAGNAVLLYRDYTYETDIRPLDMDGSGTYNQQTFAIPVGAGFMFKIAKKASFMVGTSLHYMFTDHIDGLTPSVPGPLKGTVTHDMFLFTSVSLRYDLTRAKDIRTPEDKSEERYDGVDFAALLNDTVTYPKADTTSPDSLAIQQWHDRYFDSTGRYSNMQYDSSGAMGHHPTSSYANGTNTIRGGIQYTVELGHYTQGVPADAMDKFLSIPDVKSNMLKDSSAVYTAGNYSNYADAKNRQDELRKNGIPDAVVVYKNGDNYIPANGTEQGANNTTVATNTGNNTGNNNTGVNNTTTGNKTGNENKTGTENKTVTENNTTTNPENKTSVTNTTNPENKTGNTGNNTGNNTANNTTNNTPPATGAIIYRVQLGAYKHKLSKNIYSDVSDVVEVKTENGYYTYSAGSFTSYQAAADYKAKLITQGFTDAFIKAYQNGKRIPLEKAGATYVKPTKEDMNEEPTKEQIAMDKSQISFKVQVGAFKGTPPAKLAAIYKIYSNLTTESDNGLTHYLVGPYSDYKAAKDMKAEAEASGIQGAFIVAYFKGKPIPVSEALDILRQ